MTSIDRRTFLDLALTGTAGAILPGAAFARDETPGLIDTNIHLFRWPTRRLPLDNADALVAKLRSFGITQAWAGSFEGLLHRDFANVNRRLAEACRAPAREILVPFGSVNPALPGWRAELRRCREEHGMPGVRLHPNYHGYPLDDPRFEELLALAAEQKLIVQLAASMEDRRTQHPHLQVPDVDLRPLSTLAAKHPRAKILILNFKPGAALLEPFKDTPNVFFEIARVEDTHGVARLQSAIGSDRVLFGTHAPFFIPESAFIKAHESDLDEGNTRALFSTNAQKILHDRDAPISSPSPPTGLPPRRQLEALEIWDSYFSLFDTGPNSDRLFSEIERTLPTIEKGAIQRLCLFPHVGIGTADATTESRLRKDPASVLAPFERWPGKFIGMIQLNANDVPASLDALDRWLRDGPMLGVYFPGSGPGALTCTHPNYNPLVTRIAELGGLIMQHNWFITGGKARPGQSTPSELAILAARFPEQTFLSAHAGGEWEKGIRAVRASPNVLVETSGFDPTAGFIEMAVRELGAERIVFGTHLPSRSLGTELGKVIGAGITEADKHLILGANYRRLLAPLLRKKGLE